MIIKDFIAELGGKGLVAWKCFFTNIRTGEKYMIFSMRISIDEQEAMTLLSIILKSPGTYMLPRTSYTR
jgi:hypothetical protein